MGKKKRPKTRSNQKLPWDKIVIAIASIITALAALINAIANLLK